MHDLDNQPLLVRVNPTLRRVLFLFPTLWLGIPALLYLPVIAPKLPLDDVLEALPYILALIPVGMIGVLGLSRIVMRTPALELDQDGFRIRAPFPAPPHWDLALAWDDVQRIQATSHYMYSRGWWRFDSLWFVPPADVPVQLGWRDRLLSIFDLSRAPRVRGYRVGISNGWTHSVNEVVTYAQRQCPGLHFTDDRQDSPFGRYARRPEQPPK